MELLKTEHSQSKRNGKLDKVLLKCDEPNFYKLINFLYYYKIDVVLKFGILESIEKEYQINQELLSLPNFIRYFCIIKCNDDIKNIKNIINNKNTISNYKMCYYGDNLIGILVMKHYYLGSIENYIWNESNFNILKNVIKQVVFSIIYAYENKGFIHGDLHSGNVLLKHARNNEIIYGKKILEINEFEVVIGDFEKSKFNNSIVDLIKGIIKFINSIVDSNNIIINIDYDRNKLIKLKSIFLDNIDYYNSIENIIDNMEIYN